MKKLIPLLFCFVAANAFASSADSGVCPWKMPFTIIVHASGNLHRYQVEREPVTSGYWEKDTDLGTTEADDTFNLTLDTSHLQLDSSYYDVSYHYSLWSEILQFSLSYDDSSSLYGPYKGSSSQAVVITFERGKDSMISIDWSEESGYSEGAWGQSYRVNLSASSLSFDDTSIFSSDSVFSRHAISISTSEEQDAYTFPPDQYVPKMGTFTYSDFTATSVTLSGIFRPTTFSNPAAVEHTRPPGSLDIHASNGSIACSFDISDQARELEIYSPLGIRVESVAIPPEENHASLPVLQPGFYFVRLDGAVRKILVGE